ncbi:hypothetical protein D3C72_2402980 [compost metagenome]
MRASIRVRDPKLFQMLCLIDGTLIAEVQDAVRFLAFDHLPATILVRLRRFQRRVNTAEMLWHSHR